MVGYDDSTVAEHAEPPMTSVNQPTELMGREMARLLVDVAIPRAAEAEAITLDTRLVVRGSG